MLILWYATIWKNLEDIMLSEMNKSQKEIVHDSKYMNYLK